MRLWFWDWCKWYVDEPEYFPEVAFIEKLLDELPDEDYRFIRLGEDGDDYEERGSLDDPVFDVHYVRHLELESPGIHWANSKAAAVD